jgi:DNA-binding NarL/FixJ family response regulator
MMSLHAVLELARSGGPATVGLPSTDGRRRLGTATPNPIRVALADDHAIFREGVRALLGAVPGMAVVGEADNAATAVDLVRRVAPHVLVLDLDMPDGDGANALPVIKREAPQVRVLILTAFREQDRLLQVLELGASGYLPKESALDQLVDAIRAVSTGEIYVRPAAARLLATEVVSDHDDRTARGRYKSLSPREQVIVREFAAGYNLTEIARHLGISGKTVDTYKSRVQEKLGLRHRTDFVRFAVEAGLFEI